MQMQNVDDIMLITISGEKHFQNGGVRTSKTLITRKSNKNIEKYYQNQLFQKSGNKQKIKNNLRKTNSRKVTETQ